MPSFVRFLAAMFLAVMVVVMATASANAAPRITIVTPAATVPGTLVTVTGTGFTDDNSISAGRYRWRHVQVHSAHGATQTLRVKLPYWFKPGSYLVVVENSGGESNALPLIVLGH